MARFDVYLGKRGYLLDVQSESLEMLESRIVVPLVPNTPSVVPFARLNPVFQINGRPLMMMTQLLTAVRKSILGVKQGSVAFEADEITRAIDMALQGF